MSRLKPSEKDAQLYLRRSQQLEKLILNLLRAPYERMTAWATTEACQSLKHPIVRNDGKTCACGRRT